MKRRGAMRMAALMVGSGFLPVSGAHAQSEANLIPRIELKAGEKVPVANFGASFSLIGPIHCDSAGNVYLRPVSGKMDYFLAPILRISADGQHMTPLDAGNTPEIKEAAEFAVYDFAIPKDGAILELAGITTKEKERLTVVVEIDAEDKTASVIHVDSQFSPSQISPMPSGMFLLSGLHHSTQFFGKEFRQSTKPFTAIFDSRGTMIREIHLPGDIKIPDIDSSNMDKPDNSGLVAVSLTNFAVADDGTIYLMRSGSTPKIYVLSSAGEVLRSFELVPPAADTLPLMFYLGGQLAFAFLVPNPKDEFLTNLVIRVVDPQDGRILWDYVGAEDADGIPACYSGKEFTVLSHTADHHLALLKLSAH